MIIIAVGVVVVLSVLGLVAYALLTAAKEADEAFEHGEKRDCFAERAMTKAEAQAERFKDARPTARFVCPATGNVINDKECADTARFRGCDTRCPYPGSHTLTPPSPFKGEEGKNGGAR